MAGGDSFESGSRSHHDYTASMLAGATAGVISRVCCFPLDTIKSKLQAHVTKVSFSNVLSSTMRAEGIGGLYRGIGVAVVGSCPAACMYFAGYQASRDHLREREWFRSRGWAADLTAGFIAEAVSCVLWVPIDVIKERLQVQSSLKGAQVYKSSWDACRTILRKEGLSGLYKGYFATLSSFGPFSGLYFLLYEQMKQATMRWTGVKHENDLPSRYALLHGAGAGGLAGFLTNGLDMAKLRLQVQSPGYSHAAGMNGMPFRYKGMVQALYRIMKNEGPVAMFKGAGTRVLFLIPSQAISISAFEELKKMFQRALDRQQSPKTVADCHYTAAS